jgi:hypothetical protein
MTGLNLGSSLFTFLLEFYLLLAKTCNLLQTRINHKRNLHSWQLKLHSLRNLLNLRHLLNWPNLNINWLHNFNRFLTNHP